MRLLKDTRERVHAKSKPASYLWFLRGGRAKTRGGNKISDVCRAQQDSAKLQRPQFGKIHLSYRQRIAAQHTATDGTGDVKNNSNGEEEWTITTIHTKFWE